MRYLLAINLVLICQGAHAADLTDEVRGCRALLVESDRLACYDQMRIAEDDPADASVTSAAAGTQAEPEEAVAPESDFGLEFSVKDAAPSVTSTIAEVRKNAKGGLVVTLANEQVWQQSGSERLFLDAGDSVTIFRGALSAFYLAPDGKGRRYRFARVK